MAFTIPTSTLDHLVEGIILIGQDGVITYCNSRFEKIFGLQVGSSVGRKIEDLAPCGKNCSWNDLTSAKNQIAKTTKFTVAGREKDISLKANPILIDNAPATIMYFNDFSLEDYITSPTNEGDAGIKSTAINVDELYFVASLPEMANSSNSSEEFLSRVLSRLVRNFRFRAIGTYVINSQKEFSLAGFNGDGSMTQDDFEHWFMMNNSVIQAQVQQDQAKEINLENGGWVSITPHKKRNTMFAVSICFNPPKKPFVEGEKKLLQIMGNQLAVSYENSKLLEGSTVDNLTKIFNARFFHNRLNSELLIAQQTESPLSLLLFDVDHFKKFNDTYGHQLGDQVLSEVAKVVKSTCRSSDIVARYGGEEFALILIDTDMVGAKQVGEKVRAAIEKHIIDQSRPEIKVTISVGVANFPDSAQTKDEMIRRADKALYQAKGAGRNKVICYQKSNK